MPLSEGDMTKANGEPMTPTEKKQEVACRLLLAAGNLVEFWSEQSPHADEIDAEFARECLNKWLRRLPGTTWDTRLDPPNTGN